jgi:hypothetical protein
MHPTTTITSHSLLSISVLRKFSSPLARSGNPNLPDDCHQSVETAALIAQSAALRSLGCPK